MDFGPPMPTPRSGVAGAYYHGLIWCSAANCRPTIPFPRTRATTQSPTAGSTLAPMPHGRHGFGGAAIGDNAYFVGGNLGPGGGESTDQLIMFHLP